MANVSVNFQACKAALEDMDSKPIPKRKKFFDKLMPEIRPRRKLLDQELADYIPDNLADVDGDVCNSDGKIIATVVDGVVVLLP